MNQVHFHFIERFSKQNFSKKKINTYLIYINDSKDHDRLILLAITMAILIH